MCFFSSFVSLLYDDFASTRFIFYFSSICRCTNGYFCHAHSAMQTNYWIVFARHSHTTQPPMISISFSCAFALHFELTCSVCLVCLYREWLFFFIFRFDSVVDLDSVLFLFSCIKLFNIMIITFMYDICHRGNNPHLADCRILITDYCHYGTDSLVFCFRLNVYFDRQCI